jgi:hypothetical protein
MLWIVYREYCVVLLFHTTEDRVYAAGNVMTLVTGACWEACYLFFPKIFPFQPEAHFTAFMIVAKYYKCLYSIEEDIWA